MLRTANLLLYTALSTAVSVAALLLLMITPGVVAQEQSKPTERQTPLAEVLNADGTLNLKRGFSGSLDPAGWQMVRDANGRPRFVRDGKAATQTAPPPSLNVAEDSNWDDRFGRPGVAAASIAVSGENVYVGGVFRTAGRAVSRGVAKWDGRTWSALGDGIGIRDNSNVYSVAVSGNDVYVGGRFIAAGDQRMNNLAKWDGEQWSAVGGGVGGCTGHDCLSYVGAIAVSGTDVYVGGRFNTAGGVRVNNIAKWDGEQWWALGSGTNGNVNAIAVNGNDVYIGGTFTTAGNMSANYVARWDGESWSALGSGMNPRGYVYALAVNGTDVYAGGRFYEAGGVEVNGIARWDGSGWSALGGGVNNFVTAITISEGAVHIGGAFTTASGVEVNRVARWDGSSWSAVGGGVGSSSSGGIVESLAVSGSDLYVGGTFAQAGSIAVDGVAKWDSSSWSALADTSQHGLNGSVSSIVVSGSDIYVGGTFTAAGTVQANYIARWDGSNWSALGSGLNGPVTALGVSGSDLYVGGMFTMAGGVSTRNVAKWDGASWYALGDGVSSCLGPPCSLPTVYALAVSGSDVYVGGAFREAGGQEVNGIARWDGSNWSALGSGVNSSDLYGVSVQAIAVSGDDVYVGGSFYEAGGVIINGNIAKWDGSRWSSLGNDPARGPVLALTASEDGIYVGSSYGGIAKWDGANWSSFLALSDFAVYKIVVNGSDIYVGGNTIAAGGAMASGIAKWDGTSWSALGSGTAFDGFVGPVLAIAVNGCDVYIGGDFPLAGGKPSTNFGQWNSCQAPPAAESTIN